MSPFTWQKENEIIEKTLPEINPDKAKEAGELLKSIRKAVQKKGHISEGMWPFNC